MSNKCIDTEVFRGCGQEHDGPCDPIALYQNEMSINVSRPGGSLDIYAHTSDEDLEYVANQWAYGRDGYFANKRVYTLGTDEGDTYYRRALEWLNVNRSLVRGQIARSRLRESEEE